VSVFSADFEPPPDWSELRGQLKLNQSVALDATGSGVIFFQAGSANQRWVIRHVVVSTNQPATATVVPYATLALNTTSLSAMSQGNQRGTSWAANNDTFTGMMDVGQCDYLTVLFYPPPGATPAQIAALAGVQATAVATGTRYTRTG
jgi:hypothetical protein